MDFLILETFFHLQEMLIALDCARASGLEALATMSFRPTLAASSDGHSPEECAKQMADAGAAAVGANCEQEPSRIVPLVQAMGDAAGVPVAAQPAAFRTSAETPCFTKMPQFPDELETIQVARSDFEEFGRKAAEHGFGFVGGCCGCNAAYVRALAAGIGAS